MVRLFALIGLIAMSSQAQAVEPARYFLFIFGADDGPLQPRKTHTWATAVRLTGTPVGVALIEPYTISWMPATLQIRPYALRPEPGVNLSLETTFQWIDSFQGHVSYWGPFAISQEQFDNFLARKATLESGAVAYRALGGTRNDPTISNCGQSFTRVSRVVGQRFQPTPTPGEQGTSVLVRRYMRAGTLTPLEPNGIAEALGLQRPNTEHRVPGERVPRHRVSLFR